MHFVNNTADIPVQIVGFKFAVFVLDWGEKIVILFQ